MIAQHHGIRKRPKRHCVFYHAGHAVKVGDVAERDDQVIVFELELARAEPGADGYDLLLQSMSSTSRMIRFVRGQRRRMGETTLVRPIDPEMTSGSIGWYTQ